ncbi:MAG: hypothetical protein AAFO82_03235 [Bacteroidota bacterium]
MKETTTYKGNINNSGCEWCYEQISSEQLIEGIKEIGGIKFIKLLSIEENWSNITYKKMD